MKKTSYLRLGRNMAVYAYSVLSTFTDEPTEPVHRYVSKRLRPSEKVILRHVMRHTIAYVSKGLDSEKTKRTKHQQQTNSLC